MELHEFLKLIKRKKQTIFIIIIVCLIITLGLALTQSFKYGSQSRLLVVQNNTGADAYTLSKSNEYLGNLFSQVAYSSSFYNFVLSSQYDIDDNYFSGDENQKLKKWRQTVQTKTISDTGIIEINIYHPNYYQAQQLALAVNDVLINKNLNYQGNGQGIKIVVIDQPLVSTRPVKPNLPYLGGLALVGGFILALFYIYIFPEEKNSLELIRKKAYKKLAQNPITPNLYNSPQNQNNSNNPVNITYQPLENQVIETAEIGEQSAQDIRPTGNINNVFRN